MRQQAALALWLVAAVGCVGGGSDPADEHELWIGLAATIEDVYELGIDAGGCEDASSLGAYPVPVDGRPDLVAIALDNAVICVTTLEAAEACGLDLSNLAAAGVVVLVAENGEGSEPEPQPYVRAQGGGAASEPEPQPYAPMSSEPEPQPYAEGGEAEEPEPQPY